MILTPLLYIKLSHLLRPLPESVTDFMDEPLEGGGILMEQGKTLEEVKIYL